MARRAARPATFYHGERALCSAAPDAPGGLTRRRIDARPSTSFRPHRRANLRSPLRPPPERCRTRGRATSAQSAHEIFRALSHSQERVGPRTHRARRSNEGRAGRRSRRWRNRMPGAHAEAPRRGRKAKPISKEDAEGESDVRGLSAEVSEAEAVSSKRWRNGAGRLARARADARPGLETARGHRAVRRPVKTRPATKSSARAPSRLPMKPAACTSDTE